MSAGTRPAIRNKVSNEDWKLIILVLLAFFYFFVPGSILGLNPTLEGWMKNAISLFLIAVSVPLLKLIFKGPYIAFNVILLLLAVVHFLSVVLNADFMSSLSISLVSDADVLDFSAVTSPKAVIFNNCVLLAFVLQIENASLKNKSNIVARTLLYAFAVLVLISDMDALFSSKIANGAGYILRDKFTVCYMNLFLCCVHHFLHPTLKGTSRHIQIALVVLLEIIAFVTECSTVVVAGLIYAFLIFFLRGKLKMLLRSPYLLLLLIISLDILFFFFAPLLMQMDLIHYIIVDILHEDPTLTGRLEIYLEIRTAFQESPWLGFGQGNSFIASEYFANAPDAQNGMVDVFLQTGILGCVVFIALLFAAFKQIGNNYVYSFPIVALIYTMVCISMVEIPFNAHFLFFTSLLLMKRQNETVVRNGGNRQ